MNIENLTKRLNEKAFSGNFSVARLPELRKKYLDKKQLPSTIFTARTIFDGSDKYAFHYGGRDEMQFNVGEEHVNNVAVIRWALCFSLEASPSLHDPVGSLAPFRLSFNNCFQKYTELFNGLTMWYYQNGERHGNFQPQTIPDVWFQKDTFICLGNIINKPLAELNENDISEILMGFDKLLPIYEFCVLKRKVQVNSEVKIFTRLTSNENHWELPSFHRWNLEDQGKKNVPFENQYGFGHEEWLLNSRYIVNGFQYGFIRGIQDSDPEVKRFEEVHLYTVKKEKGKSMVYYLGFIKDVIVIKDDSDEQEKISEVIDSFYEDMVMEVQSFGGDTRGIVEFRFKPDVKFKPENVVFLEEPVFQPEFNLGKYKRFQPYRLTSSIREIFENITEGPTAGFVAGKSSQTAVFSRKSRESSIVIEKVHSEIVEALEKYLKPAYSLIAKNISIEKTRFHGNIADVVTLEADGSISIYEVKTSLSGRRNIRDAIAQLLDYALHTEYRIKNLIIVSPVWLIKSDIYFLEQLKMKISFPLEYLHYQRDDIRKFVPPFL